MMDKLRASAYEAMQGIRDGAPLMMADEMLKIEL